MTQQREESLTLELLSAIEAKSDVTQRHIADRMGVALGLANSYLKRCVRKGLVKITQAPANRYLYYLTPTGFAEKSRLTAQYFSYSFDFYRRASASTREALALCAERNWRRLLFIGTSELAEIAFVSSHDFKFEIIGTYAAGSGLKAFLGRPVWEEIPPLDKFDGAIFCALDGHQAWFERVTQEIPVERLVFPELVKPLMPVTSNFHAPTPTSGARS